MDKKPVTIKEIARRLGISVSAVSKALHEDPSIGLGTRMRVQKLAKELNYEPNQTAIFLQKGMTHTIGVIIPYLGEAFFPEAISGIEEIAIKNNYVVLLGQSMEDPEREKMLLETMRKHRVDGLLVSTSINTIEYEPFRKIKESIPLVFFDRIPDMEEIHYVGCDIISGTMKAMGFLLEKGHRVIGLVNGPEKFSSSRQRLEGYRQALEKNRLKYDPSLVIHCDLSPEAARQATEELLQNKRSVTAMVAYHDYVAMHINKYLKQIRKYKDITVVGFANLSTTEHSLYRPAATIEQHPFLQGQKAMEILAEIIRNKQQAEEKKPAYFKIILDSHLVVF